MELNKFLDHLFGGLLGNKGVTITTDTAAVTGKFCAMTALEDTVIATIVGEGIYGDKTGINLSAGSTFYARFTGYTLTSGSVAANHA